jgi:hypothetical protein
MTETERKLDLLLGDALAENERLKSELQSQNLRKGWLDTHSLDCWGWGPRHYECALRHIRGSNDAS